MFNKWIWAVLMVGLTFGGCDIIDTGGGGGGSTDTATLDGNGTVGNPWDAELGKTYAGTIVPSTPPPIDTLDGKWFKATIEVTATYEGRLTNFDTDLMYVPWEFTPPSTITYFTGTECDEGIAGENEICSASLNAGDIIYIQIFNWDFTTTDYKFQIKKL